MKRYVSFLFLISICLCQRTEKHENSDNKELKQHLSKSGEHLIKYVDSYFINTGIAFLGYLAFDYGIKILLKLLILTMIDLMRQLYILLCLLVV